VIPEIAVPIAKCSQFARDLGRSWFRKSMMRRACVIVANNAGATLAKAFIASPTMMNSRSTDERTSLFP
jgi:hypothetical protein